MNKTIGYLITAVWWVPAAIVCPWPILQGICLLIVLINTGAAYYYYINAKGNK
jgi:hypothetical protein